MHRLAALALIGLAGAACGASHGHYSTTSLGRAHVVRFTVDSRLLGRRLEQVGVIGGGGRRPLLVLLHGRSMPPDGLLSDQLFTGLRSLRRRAPNIVFANGGDHSYFHDRPNEPWGAYVLREVIPAAVKRLGADPHRIAIGGVSMGGFGAFDLARIAPDRFCAVGGHSAALWFHGGDTAPGAFDDAADFARHDLIRFAAARRVYRLPVWIDVGRDDPFLQSDTSLADELRRRATRVQFIVHSGGQSGWSGRMQEYLRFYASACGH